MHLANHAVPCCAHNDGAQNCVNNNGNGDTQADTRAGDLGYSIGTFQDLVQMCRYTTGMMPPSQVRSIFAPAASRVLDYIWRTLARLVDDATGVTVCRPRNQHRWRRYNPS